MTTLVLLASMAAEPPKETGVSGVVTAVSASTVTLAGGEPYRLTKDTLYLLESGLDPWVVGAKDLVKGHDVDLALVNGVVVRVFIKRLTRLAPAEVLKLESVGGRVNVPKQGTDGMRKTRPEPRNMKLPGVTGAIAAAARSQKARRDRDAVEYGRSIQRAYEAWTADDIHRPRELLDCVPWERRGWEWYDLSPKK